MWPGSSSTGYTVDKVCEGIETLDKYARQRTVMVNLKVRVYIDEFPQDDEFPRIEYGDVSGKPRAIVVGAGPAGLFAALRLIELGICPVVVERGKNVHDRRKDIALISREQRVDPESNYSFGEGGAGAFSDGKLYTQQEAGKCRAYSSNFLSARGIGFNPF